MSAFECQAEWHRGCRRPRHQPAPSRPVNARANIAIALIFSRSGKRFTIAFSPFDQSGSPIAAMGRN
jgi:hypothetical protein